MFLWSAQQENGLIGAFQRSPPPENVTSSIEQREQLQQLTFQLINKGLLMYHEKILRLQLFYETPRSKQVHFLKHNQWYFWVPTSHRVWNESFYIDCGVSSLHFIYQPFRNPFSNSVYVNSNQICRIDFMYIFNKSEFKYPNYEIIIEF